MKEIILSPAMSGELADIYTTMEQRYDRTASEIGLGCAGCPDNCCDSYFLHHTYCEWAYLWEGIQALDDQTRQRITLRSQQYVAESRKVLARGERPNLTCPLLNDDGRCSLYAHRLMICRLHGVPAAMTRPDGRTLKFPGCFRCQEIVREKYEREKDVPFMDRTELLGRIAALESELLGGKRHLFPKVRRTIAEMITAGPPRIDKPFCER
jgi:Fe-S-cluster containining protein